MLCEVWRAERQLTAQWSVLMLLTAITKCSPWEHANELVWSVKATHLIFITFMWVRHTSIRKRWKLSYAEALLVRSQSCVLKRLVRNVEVRLRDEITICAADQQSETWKENWTSTLRNLPRPPAHHASLPFFACCVPPAFCQHKCSVWRYMTGVLGNIVACVDVRSEFWKSWSSILSQNIALGMFSKLKTVTRSPLGACLFYSIRVIQTP